MPTLGLPREPMTGLPWGSPPEPWLYLFMLKLGVAIWDFKAGQPFWGMLEP